MTSKAQNVTYKYKNRTQNVTHRYQIKTFPNGNKTPKCFSKCTKLTERERCCTAINCVIYYTYSTTKQESIMFDFTKPLELNKTYQQIESYIKQARDFWIDIAIDTIKMYKAK